MNLTKYLGVPVVAAVLALGGVWYGESLHQNSIKSGSFPSAPIYASATNSSVLCSPTSAQVVATSSNPGILRLTNVSTTSPVTIWLTFGNPPAVVGQGVPLFASSSIEFNSTNFYAGTIYCITASGSASTSIMETK